MGPLTLIWVTALVLMAGAFAWMSALMALRVRHARAEARRSADRQAVMGALVAILRQAPDAHLGLAPYTGRARLMAEVLLEFQALIRGTDREVVLEALRRLGLVSVLCARLDRGSKAGRLACLDALAAFGGAEAERAMRRAIRQPDPDIRIAALKGLVDAGARIDVGRVLDYLATHEIAPSRLTNEIIRYVTARDPPATVWALSRQDLTPFTHALLVESLGSSGDYRVIPSLIQASSHADPEVRTAAVRGMGRLMHPAAEPAVGRALADPIWHVRAAAAEAAGAAGLARLGEALALLLGDPQWWVRFRAAEALTRLGSAGLAWLETAAASAPPRARRTAGLALADWRAR